MKKLLLIILTLAICTGVTACNSDEADKKETKTEYTMTEFKELLKPVYEKVREDSEYLTNEEQKRIWEIFIEECKKQGLPVGEKITLRGKVHYIWSENGALTITISSQTKDDDYTMSDDIPIWCEVKNCPEAVFLNENEVIAVEGIFLKENSDDYLMFDCEIKSPTTIEANKYENNIKVINDEALDSYSEFIDDLRYFETDVKIYGVVTDIYDMTVANFKDDFKTLFEENEEWYEHIDNNDCVYLITDEDCMYGVWLFGDKNIFKTNQKVYVSTLLEGSIINAEGQPMVFVYGNITSADNYYIYK